MRKIEEMVDVSGPFPAAAITAAAAVEAAKTGLEYRPNPDGQTWMLLRRERHLQIVVSPGAEGCPELLEIERLLNLISGGQRYDISVGNRGNPDPQKFPTVPSNEIRIVPRSTPQVLYYMSSGIEVKTEQICVGLVSPIS